MKLFTGITLLVISAFLLGLYCQELFAHAAEERGGGGDVSGNGDVKSCPW